MQSKGNQQKGVRDILMKTFNKEEQEIIKLIQEKKIVDIYSYVKHYHLGTEIQFYEENIIEAFKNDFNDGEYNLIVRDSISGFGERPLNVHKDNVPTMFLNFDMAYRQKVESPDNKICFNFCVFKPIYICENIDKILQFISIWQYLETEQLITDLPKSCTEQDMGLFLYKQEKATKSTPGYKNVNPKLKANPINPREYMNWRLALKEHDLSLCMPYLVKQIQPTPNLDIFIKTAFITKKDLNERRNSRIAIISVLIALAAFLFSIITYMFNRGYYKELQDINNSIQEIRDELHIDEPEENADE